MTKLTFKSTFRNFAADTAGALTTYAMFLILAIMLIGGLAVDFAGGVRARAHLQAVADAAALAAAQDLPDVQLATTTALASTATNAPTSIFGDVSTNSDVSFGAWDAGTATFTAGATPTNAVRINAYRTQTYNNAVQNFFLGLVGVQTFDVRAEAIAIGTSNNCDSGGFFSRTDVEAHSNNNYTSNFCLYGDNGVKIESNNVFASDVNVEMPDLSTFTQGSNNAGIAEALQQNTRTLPLIDQVNPVVNSLTSGQSTYLPSWVTNGPIYVQKISPGDTLLPNSFYVVAESADLGSSRNVQDVVIASKGVITTGSHVTMKNVLFATDIKVEFGSYNDFGTADFCSTGEFSVTLFAKKKIHIGSYSRLRGFLMATLESLHVESRITEFSASHAEAAGKVILESADTFSGCPTALASNFTTTTGGAGFAQWGLVQ